MLPKTHVFWSAVISGYQNCGLVGEEVGDVVGFAVGLSVGPSVGEVVGLFVGGLFVGASVAAAFVALGPRLTVEVAAVVVVLLVSVQSSQPFFTQQSCLVSNSQSALFFS